MPTATVIGAGVFGASTARELTLRGWDVTLVEQYAPGTVRSGSGGDTRLLRMAHGEVAWYADSAWRARSLWLELQEETGVRIFEPVGVAWFAQRAGGFEERSRPVLDELGVPNEWLAPDDARRLFPSLGVDDLHGVLFEPDAGVLQARRATQLLVEDGERRGLSFRPGRVAPADDPGGDVVVWACGSWLHKLFPDAFEARISRRDVFFFGGDASWRGTPGFCDYDAPFYGHGELLGLGIKIAPDVPGDEVDPDTVERVPKPELERLARDYAARRFPALADAPVVGTRVCQYDLTSDTHFVFAQHPERSSWWLLGGGSGHGFKHGPALAQYVADCVEGRRAPEPFHALGERVGDAGLRTAASG
ncbi:MAG TPA: FAD-dependent oxidoreductase [Gaiellaceae bacterium]|nr:FAD-dependent oxidoreductase [Gaiellaceae bacterium]